MEILRSPPPFPGTVLKAGIRVVWGGGGMRRNLFLNSFHRDLDLNQT